MDRFTEQARELWMEESGDIPAVAQALRDTHNAALRMAATIANEEYHAGRNASFKISAREVEP